MRKIVVTAAVGLALFAGAQHARAQFGPIDDLKVAKPEDKQDVESKSAPEGATVLFDGKSLDDHWEKKDGGAKPEWEIKEGGAAQVKGGDIVTKEKFNEPILLHVEFRTPYQPNDQGQGRGNSGVYMQGRYEIQVLDSYGKPIEQYEMGDCGSIYGVAKPKVNATKPPTVWQSYDIEFHPPKFDGEKLVEPARMTVHQNGVLIHENQKLVDAKGPVFNTTAGMGGDPKTPGPILLQDHGNPVQYRNIWVKKLDQK